MATTDDHWTCPKDDCNLTAEQHNLALAVLHIYPELTEDEAQGVQDRVIERLESSADEIASIASALYELL